MAGLNNLSGTRKAAALGGFILLGASPSFIDWEQSPEKRKQIIGFYAAAITLFWYGLLS
jgi:hypothetical protein